MNVSHFSNVTKTVHSSDDYPPTPHIIICVDGVGISIINEMQVEGRFTMFHSPSHMISTFPSLTNAAISTILAPSGAKTPAGYEDNYFDVNANKMRGGIADRLRSDRFIQGTFRQMFDYHPSAIKSGLGYLAPPYSVYLESLSDLIHLQQKAKKNKQPVFLGYIGATDSLAHLGGEKLLRRFLKRLDETVQNIRRDKRVPVAVTIFSDHGNDFRPYKRAGLRAPLEQAGFKLELRIKDERSVVFPQFGLIGSAVLFTQPANDADLARATANVEGVDFAAYQKQGTVHVVGPEGEATIEKQDECYRYRSVKGDPLGLLTLVPQEFLPDSAFFDATRDNSRPDVIKRIYEGVNDSVVNRGNVVINLKDGYYTGSSVLDALATLHATHGNIGQPQSYGFVMSTDIELPSHLRADDLWSLLGSPELTRAKTC
jgi:hypothetical protein